jgi:hypothetical protein
MLRKVIAAAIVLPLLAAALYLFLPTWRAHRMLSQLTDLQVGKSTFADAQKLAASMDAAPSPGCNQTDCNWYRRIDNLSLPQFWIGEGATFSGGFRVQNGVVTERGAAYLLGSGTTPGPYADTEERTTWPGGPAPNPVSVQTQWTAHVPRYSILVLMVPSVPAETRSRYLDFNLGCLWKYQGCTDAQQLLPTVEWKD